MEGPPAKKPRGQKQRLAAMPVAESKKTSVLVTWLEEQWAWGYMSAQCIQKIASLALQDMVASGADKIPPPLQKLASIGTFGHHSGNCHRDLMNIVSRKTKVCAPLQTKITLKVGLYLQSIMLPHELFHCMWESYNSFFLQTLIPAGEPGLRFFGISSRIILAWNLLLGLHTHLFRTNVYLWGYMVMQCQPLEWARFGQKCNYVSPGAVC